MEAYWESTSQSIGLTYESGAGIESEVIPFSQEPVYILGQCYSSLYDREDIFHDILSRFWMTYRRGFSPIDTPSGPRSDAGWGCMHRCGQMMLAQAMLMIHLGRQWRWHRNIPNPTYDRILRMFLDYKGAMMSIHQIASMGVSEGKEIGKWFGPNTVAQVLKKLAVYDRWTNLVVHVAMEDGVIIDEIKNMCRIDRSAHQSPTHNSNQTRIAKPISNDLDDDCVEITLPPSAVPNRNTSQSPNRRSSSFHSSPEETGWRPLLLIVPLRLGLATLNETYVPALKAIFTLPQSVGIIGGRPSHALWFIGSVERSLIYLDPHTTQPVVPQSDSTSPGSSIPDESYHCARPGSIDIEKVDPSLAVGFLCSSEKDFNEWCETISRSILGQSKSPLFEIHQLRPSHLPPISNCNDAHDDFVYDSEEDFELL